MFKWWTNTLLFAYGACRILYNPKQAAFLLRLLYTTYSTRHYSYLNTLNVLHAQ